LKWAGGKCFIESPEMKVDIVERTNRKGNAGRHLTVVFGRIAVFRFFVGLRGRARWPWPSSFRKRIWPPLPIAG